VTNDKAEGTLRLARLFHPVLVCLCLSHPLHAQQAQLPRKGRQPEKAPPQIREPIRRLPRISNNPLPPPSPQPIPEHEPVGPMAEDRLRTLVRGNVAPLSEVVPPYSPHTVGPQPISAVASVPKSPVQIAAESVVNRWHIFPEAPWRRYADPGLDALYPKSRLIDPFNQNTLKGDFPFLGRRDFFVFTGTSETLAESRRLPVPAVASTAEPGEFNFFGRGGQFAVVQNFRFSIDLFRGSAGFRPVDWELRVTPEFNVNYTLVRENALINVDVRQSIRRTDTRLGMQELFLEKRLFSERGHFDFTSLRVGIQRFTSDFRGFVFSDEQAGARLFGTARNNIFQYNLAFFPMLEKDSNSGLNRLRKRQQSVSAANLYWNDFLTKGYNLNFSALYNHDQASFLIDTNGFLVRPAALGFPLPHKIRAGYAGISGDGHIGRINVSHAFYEAFGRDDRNPIPARHPAQRINAQLAALELSYEKDWKTFKASALYTSGDHDLNDGRANGFDAIVPNQQFAGGGFLGNPSLADRGLLNNAFAGGGTNFLNREPIPLTGTAVFLFGPNSLIPSMRPGLFEGQANFVNPGILLLNAGFDAKITPKLRSTVNVNWAKLNRTEVLEALLFQSRIHHAIGVDGGLGLQYRPLLSDNIVVTVGAGTLFPERGFKDIYTSRTLFSTFINLRMVF
jgi:hypothetical protein